MTLVDPEIYCLIGLVAVLYSSVGHAGASGYIAVLTLAGWAPEQIRPLALVLNAFVAAIATVKFAQAGCLRPAVFFRIVPFSIPAAALGGYIELPTTYLSYLIGLALCFSAIWLVVTKREPESVRIPSSAVLLCTGGAIGFLAGLSGTGGGIFLSPLMLYLRWGKIKEVSALAAPYILLNSVAGLIGLRAGGFVLPDDWIIYVSVVVVGGMVGATLGSGVLNVRLIQVLLALVLAIAGVKLLYFAHSALTIQHGAGD